MRQGSHSVERTLEFISDFFFFFFTAGSVSHSIAPHLSFLFKHKAQAFALVAEIKNSWISLTLPSWPVRDSVWMCVRVCTHCVSARGLSGSEQHFRSSETEWIMGKSENHLTDLLSWKFLISEAIRKVYLWHSCSED